jgi:hypothetical protein
MSLRVVREDPKRKGLLYVGGERGLFVSWNDGTSWEPLRLNLPTVTVTALVVKRDDLVVGTNGRSIWVFDDLTPIRQRYSAAPEEEVHLYGARPAIRYHYHPVLERAGLLGAGDNPPRGAVLHYFLKNKPKSDLVLEVHDADGHLVNHFTSKKPPEEKEEEGDYSSERYKPLVLKTDPGLHRIVWDLRYHGAEVIRGARLDGGEPRVGPVVNPGLFTLEMTADGYKTRTKLEVLPDYRTLPQGLLARLVAAAGKPVGLDDVLRQVGAEGVNPELQEQLRLALAVRDDITRLARAVEQLRAVRGQLVAHNELLAPDNKAAPLIAAAKELFPKLEALEEKLHNPRAKISYDILAQKGGAQLYSQLAWLFEMLKEGDGPATQGIREVYHEQAGLLHQYLDQWKSAQEGELARLNDLAKKLGLPVVVVPAAPERPDKGHTTEGTPRRP